MNAIPIKSTLEKIVEALTESYQGETILYPVKSNTEFAIRVKKRIPIEDMTILVNGVIDTVFSSPREAADGSQYIIEEFTPSILDFCTRAKIISHFTDLDLSLADNEMCMKLLYDTDIYEQVLGFISKEQYAAVISAISSGVDLRKAQIIAGVEERMEENLRLLEQYTKQMEIYNEQIKGIDMKKLSEAAIKIAEKSERELANNVLELQVLRDKK